MKLIEVRAVDSGAYMTKTKVRSCKYCSMNPPQPQEMFDCIGCYKLLKRLNVVKLALGGNLSFIQRFELAFKGMYVDRNGVDLVK